MEYRERINAPLLDVVDFLLAGGDYAVAWRDSYLQISARAPSSDSEGRAVHVSPYILMKTPPPPEVVADIGVHLDVMLAFWASKTHKILSFLRDRNLGRSDDAQLGLFKVLMHPKPWDTEMPPSERRAYIARSVNNAQAKTDGAPDHEELSESLEDQSPSALEMLIAEEKTVERRRWLMLSQAGLTDRDILVLGRILEGRTPAEASAAAGGPGLSPWISLKSKLARKKPADIS